MWYFMLNSGVHATITGVLLAFTIPFGDGSKNSPAYTMQHFLHLPVAFIILPIFALCNTSIELNGKITEILSNNYSLGILLGLVVGKPLGVSLFTFIATQLKLCKLPDDINWSSVVGIGMLAGIGFTMSIFITLLAFEDQNIINNAKIMILISSLISGVLGFILLKYNFRNTNIQSK